MIFSKNSNLIQDAIFFVAMSVLCLLLSHSASATPELEEELLMVADDVRTKTFTLNPASTKSAIGGLDIVGGRKYKKSNLSQENNLSSVTASAKTDYIGLAGNTPLPDGLSIGGYHYRSFKNTEMTSTERSNKPIETFTEYHSAGRVTLDLTNSMRLGVLIRHLQIHNTINGSFNTQSTTRIKGSMTGLGTGLAFDFEKAQLSLAYYQPMQGKTEILREEKRLVKPGLVHMAGSFEFHKQLSFGLGIKRYFYRRDDLALPTTADDEQETTIDLRGLDPDRFIFPYQKISMGFSLAINEKVRTLVDITQNYVQAINSPTTLPDANNDGNLSYRYYQIKLGIMLQNQKFRFGAQAFHMKYSRSLDIRDIDGTISQSERGLLLNLTYNL